MSVAGPAFMASWFAFWSVTYSRWARDCFLIGFTTAGEESVLTAQILGCLAYNCLVILLVVALV